MSRDNNQPLGVMERAYLECAIWADAESSGISCGATASSKAEQQATEDCDAFWSLAREEGLEPVLLEQLSLEEIGHNFYLDRQGHGAGFWDRNLGADGDKLSKLAKSFGEVYLSGDEGTLEDIS